jgi:Flp pilus assembly protein TadG
MLFGLSMIPIMGLAGAAMDYSAAARDRSILQAALDSGSLAGARALPTMTQAQVRTLAESYVRANLPARMQSVALTTSITSNGQGLQLTGVTTFKTGLLNILGIRTLPVAGSSASQAASTRRIEVALALDNTGSMASSGKIDALRSAALEFLDILQGSGRPVGDVLVGIVPFATSVRLDAAAFRNSSVVRRVNGESWSPNMNQWDGCLTDRESPHNVQNTLPGNTATLFPIASCADTGQAGVLQLRPLTSDFAALRSTVNAMTPAGYTNITIGAAWGWHVLSWNIGPTGFSVRNVPANTDRWLVILTDGDNTADRFGDNSTGAVDTRTRTVCSNIRTQDPTIRVITIRVVQGNANLLRDCATSPSNYYEAASASEISDVFRRIGWEISSLRLTQ